MRTRTEEEEENEDEDESLRRPRKLFMDNSTKHTKENPVCWQEGFGAFSYGHSQLTGVIDYVGDQERHHARRSFREEYLRLLKKYAIENDEKYIFRPLD